MKRKLQNKKGFTLVEVIVVIVILGILMAIAIPNVVAYIDTANEKADGLAVRNAYLAACSVVAEAYAASGATTVTINYDAIAELAGLDAGSVKGGATPDPVAGPTDFGTASYYIYNDGNKVTHVYLSADASTTGKLITYDAAATNPIVIPD